MTSLNGNLEGKDFSDCGRNVYVLSAAYCLGAALLILMTFFAPRFLSVGPSLLGLASFIYLYFFVNRYPSFSWKTWAFTIGIVLLVAVSSTWAVDSSAPLERAGKMSLVLIPCMLLLHVAWHLPVHGLTRFAKFIGLSALLLTGAIGLEMAFDFPLYRAIRGIEVYGRWGYVYNRGATVSSLLIFPALLLLLQGYQGKTRLCLIGALVIAIAGLFTFTESQSMQLAAIASAVAFIIFPYTKKMAWYALSVFVALSILMAPWIAMGMFNAFLPMVDSSSWLSSGAGPERLEIWDFVSRKIMENPLYGFGAEATRSITFDTQQLHYPSDTVLHPHNFALQLWIEYGVIGAAMGAAFCAYMIETIRKSFTAKQARFVLPVFVAALSLAATGYGLWQGWLLGLFMLAMAVTVIAVRATSDDAATS